MATASTRNVFHIHWPYIHTIAATFPEHPTERERAVYYDFFSNYDVFLPPCKSGCKENYPLELENMPSLELATRSRSAMFRWTVDLHNRINQRNGKPTMSYKEAELIYFGLAKCDARPGGAKSLQNHKKQVPSNSMFRDLVSASSSSRASDDKPNTGLIILCVFTALLVAAGVAFIAYRVYTSQKAAESCAEEIEQLQSPMA